MHSEVNVRHQPSLQQQQDLVSPYGASFAPSRGFDPLGEIKVVPNRISSPVQNKGVNINTATPSSKSKTTPAAGGDKTKQHNDAERQQQQQQQHNRVATVGPDYVPSASLYPKPQRCPSRQTGAIVTRHYDSGINPFDGRATQREAIRRASPLSVSALTTELMESEEQRLKRHRLIPITVGLESEYWVQRLDRHKRAKERRRQQLKEERRRAQKEAAALKASFSSSTHGGLGGQSCAGSTFNLSCAETTSSSHKPHRRHHHRRQNKHQQNKSGAVAGGSATNDGHDHDNNDEVSSSGDSATTSSSDSDYDDEEDDEQAEFAAKVQTLIQSMKTGRKSNAVPSIEQLFPSANAREEKRRRRQQRKLMRMQRHRSSGGGSNHNDNAEDPLEKSTGSNNNHQRRKTGVFSNKNMAEEESRKQRALAEQEVLAVESARLAHRETGVRGMRNTLMSRRNKVIDYFATPWQQAAGDDVDRKRDALLFSSSNTAHLGQHRVADALALAAARDKMIQERKDRETLEKMEKSRAKLQKKQQEQIARGEIPSGDDMILASSAVFEQSVRALSASITMNLGSAGAGGGSNNNNNTSGSSSPLGKHARRIANALSGGADAPFKPAIGSSSVTVVGTSRPSITDHSSNNNININGSHSGLLLSYPAGISATGVAAAASSTTYPHTQDPPVSPHSASTFSRAASLTSGDLAAAGLLATTTTSGSGGGMGSLTASSAFPLHRDVGEKKFRKAEETKKLKEFYQHLLPADVQYRARATQSLLLHEQRQEVLKRHARKQTDASGLEPQSKTEILISRIMHIHNTAATTTGGAGAVGAFGSPLSGAAAATSSGPHHLREGIPQLSGAKSGLDSSGLLQLNIHTQSRYVTRAQQHQQQRSQYGLTLSDVRAMRDEFVLKTDLEYLKLINTKMATSNSLGDRLVSAREVKAALARSEGGVNLTFDNMFRVVYGTGAKAVPVSALNALLEQLKEEDALRDAHHPFSFRRFCTIDTAKDLESSFAAMVDFCKQHFGAKRGARNRVSSYGEVGVTCEEYCAYLRRQSSVPVSKEQAEKLFRQYSIPQHVEKNASGGGLHHPHDHHGSGHAQGARKSASGAKGLGLVLPSVGGAGRSAVGRRNSVRGGSVFASSQYGGSHHLSEMSGASELEDEIVSSDAETVPSSDDEQQQQQQQHGQQDGVGGGRKEKSLRGAAFAKSANNSPGLTSKNLQAVDDSPQHHHDDNDDNDGAASSVSSWTSSCSTCPESWSSGSQQQQQQVVSGESCASSSVRSSSAASATSSGRSSDIVPPSSGASNVLDARRKSLVPPIINNSSTGSSTGRRKSVGNNNNNATVPGSGSRKDVPKKTASPNDASRKATSSSNKQSKKGTDKGDEKCKKRHAHKKHKPSVPHYQLPTGSAATSSRWQQRPVDDDGKSGRHREHRHRPRAASALESAYNPSASTTHRQPKHRHHHHHRKHRVVPDPASGNNNSHVVAEDLQKKKAEQSARGAGNRREKRVRRKYIMTVEEWALLLMPSLKTKIDQLKEQHRQHQERDSVFINAAKQSGLHLDNTASGGGGGAGGGGAGLARTSSKVGFDDSSSPRHAHPAGTSPSSASAFAVAASGSGNASAAKGGGGGGGNSKSTARVVIRAPAPSDAKSPASATPPKKSPSSSAATGQSLLIPSPPANRGKKDGGSSSFDAASAKRELGARSVSFVAERSITGLNLKSN